MTTVASNPAASLPIGIFDSGLGGLSILKEIERELPRERLVYFADNLHLPYGSKSLAEVWEFCAAIAGRLIEYPVKAVVVACNTASAASLKRLRQVFPVTPFIGMEPAVKPAAAATRSRKVGVLATQSTFQGELFESVVERFASDMEVLRQPCPGLAEFIERHSTDHPGLKPRLEKFIQPLLERGVDNLVLACTHYSLVREVIQEVAGQGVAVIDPSPAIASRARQVLAESGLLAGSDGRGGGVFYASGDAEAFSRAASRILGRGIIARKDSERWIPADDPS
ncbi:MAG: glutamate racemase [Planctomycetes bacterium]|nr:glutamate racemase [Planctomycetota bacterium]